MAAGEGAPDAAPRHHWRGHGVLLVAVPALEAWVRARTAHYDEAFVSDEPGFPHAHVTVLAPFPPERTALVARLAAASAPFAFTLARVEAFPDGVIHAVPEPSDGFRLLTDAARAACPEIVPYWGRVPHPAPHVTLDRVGESVSCASTRALLGGVLPASGWAEELVLTWWEAGNCRTILRAPLGGEGAARAW